MAEAARAPVATVALIPLRAGSKGLPGKNVRPLAGRPLYRHSIEQAHAACIDRVLISTDIEEVLSADFEDGVTALRRPAELASDTASINAVLRHFLRESLKGPATVVLLQATAPLRNAVDIAAALALHARGGFDVVMSTTFADRGVLKWGQADGDRFLSLSEPEYCFTNRAELPPVFRPNGAVFVFDADWFRAAGTLAAGRIGMTVMPPERSLDIDQQSDFDAVEARLLDDGYGATNT